MTRKRAKKASLGEYREKECVSETWDKYEHETGSFKCKEWILNLRGDFSIVFVKNLGLKSIACMIQIQDISLNHVCVSLFRNNILVLWLSGLYEICYEIKKRVIDRWDNTIIDQITFKSLFFVSSSLL